MLDHYDLDPVAALTTALFQTLEVRELTWIQLVDQTAFTDNQRVDLLSLRTEALDDLLKHLVENRSL